MPVKCNRCGQDVSKEFASLLDSTDEQISGCPMCGIDLLDDQSDDTDDYHNHDHYNRTNNDDDDNDPDPPLIGVGIDDLLAAEAGLETSA